MYHLIACQSKKNIVFFFCIIHQGDLLLKLVEVQQKEVCEKKRLKEHTNSPAVEERAAKNK